MNDVIVCQDISTGGRTYYTVLVVYDRAVAKELLELYHAGGERAKSTFVADFTWKDAYLMVFDYVRERPVEQFFSSEIATLAECEQFCLNLTVECLASGIPYPVLYLQLLQDQIHISKDRSAYLGYCIDLEPLSEAVGERDCATLCAQKIFALLGNFQSGKATSYQLLVGRSQKSGYQRFTDLYKDLKMAAVPLKKDGILQRIRRFFRQHQDGLFRLLLIICLVLG
ncbi:MAG: hypothetical protein ACI4TP_05405, partial [Anaerotignum sp.]